jgi:glycosyltransferase involved in cell wall biosynthesis
MPLWREINAQSKVETRIIFLTENLTQNWNIKLQDDSRVEVLQGSRASKLMQILFLIREHDLNLLHLAGWGHPLLMAALIYAGIRRIPITVESDTQNEPTRSVFRRSIKAIILPFVLLIPKFFFPAGTRQASYLMSYGVKPQKICIAQMTVDVRAIISNVDRNRIETASVACSLQPVTFLYVGRLEPYKGIQQLLDAFSSLVNRGENCRLVIVGDGSLRELVESVARDQPLIDYLGRLTEEALFSVYSRANVFVLPSLIEPWGLVVNEAMAASLPVIATDRVGCVTDLVHDGETGFIVPNGCTKSLAGAMLKFIIRPEIAIKMGQKGRQLISSWTIEDEARILNAAWDKL